MFSRSFVEKFIEERQKKGALFETCADGDSFLYFGRGQPLRTLLQRNDSTFRVANSSLVHALFRRPLFNLEGEEHRSRRVMWKRVLTTKHIRKFIPTILDSIDRRHSSWGRKINLRREMRKLMTDVCAKTIIGFRTASERHAFSFFYERFCSAQSPAPGKCPIRNSVRFVFGLWSGNLLRLLFSRQTRKLREVTSSHFSVLGDLVITGQSFDQAKINDDLLALLVATRDTTSNVLVWLLYELAQRPELQTELRRECVASIAAGAGTDIYSKLTLPRCQSFINETLRLHSPNIFAMKECTRSTMVGERFVSYGTRCAYSPLFEHFDESVFSNPRQFQPYRFRDGASVASLLSFGSGSHSCLGKHFAELILLLVLTRLVCLYRLSATSNPKMDYEYSVGGKIPLENICIGLIRN